MKTFNKTFLPDSVEYNNNTYVMDAALSSEYNQKPTSTLNDIKFKDCVLVKVTNKNLKGKTDLYNQPYKPSCFIFKKI